MVSKDAVLKTLGGLMDHLREHYGVKRMGLFGSVAREGAGSESDIDLLVEFERPIGFFKFLELEEFLTDRLGQKVDLVSRRALKPRIGARILEEVVDV
ncbi:MAG: nucleotidyltransferase family protein [Candidatus Brocadiia bacterium]